MNHEVEFNSLFGNIKKIIGMRHLAESHIIKKETLGRTSLKGLERHLGNKKN
jgi:hypothetical protein